METTFCSDQPLPKSFVLLNNLPAKGAISTMFWF